jgi:hypothetical protein
MDEQEGGRADGNGHREERSDVAIQRISADVPLECFDKDGGPDTPAVWSFAGIAAS